MRNKDIIIHREEIENESAHSEGILDGILEKSRILLIFLAVFSTAWCLTTGMELDIYKEIWFVAVAVVVIFVYLLYGLMIRFPWTAWVSMPMFLLGYGLVCYYYMEDILQGFYYIAKKFVMLVKIYYKVTLLEPSSYINGISLMHDKTYYVTFFIIMVSVLVTAFISIVYYMRLNAWLYLLYTAPFVILPLALGKTPDSLTFILYIAVTITVMGSVRGQRKIKDSRIQGRVMMVMAMYCLLIVGLVYLVYPKYIFQETMDLRQTKKDFQNKVTELSKMEVFTGMTVEQWARYNFSRGIDYGKLGGSDGIKYNKNTVLKVSMNSHNIKENANYLYLKGYIGEFYKGDHWKTFYEEERTGYKEDMEELLSKGIDIENANHLFLQYVESPMGKSRLNYIMGGNKIFDSMGEEKLHIKNVAAGKGRMFVPYFPGPAYTMNENGCIRLYEREDEYDIAYYPEITRLTKGLVTGFKEVSEGGYLIQSFLDGDVYNGNKEIKKKFTAINKFVNRYYSIVPENVQTISLNNVMNLMVNALEEDLEELYRTFYIDKYGFKPEDTFIVEEYIVDGKAKKAFVSSLDTWNEDMKEFVKELSKVNLHELIRMVQRYLWDQTSYTLAPGKTPVESDFVDYFMFENKKGYCVHYATTATLLFRTLGIPARMVEGYVLSPESMYSAKEWSKAKSDTEMFTVNVKDNNAHAWVEIYIDNMGWIPIEVTPSAGYSDVPEEPDVTPIPTVNSMQNEMPDREEPNKYPMPTPNDRSQKERLIRYSGSYGRLLKELDALSEYLALPRVSYVIMILALFSFITTILSIRKRIYKVYRIKVLPKKNTKRRVVFLYHRLALAFRLYGVVYDRQSVERYAEELIEKFEFLGLVDAKSAFLDIVFKNVYARETVSEEEYQDMKDFYEIFCSRLYKNVKPHNRWYMENILCLY